MSPSFFFFFPKLDFLKVENDPRLKLIYTECLRLCGTWLAETCLENPTVIMQKYLEKVRPVFQMYSLGDNAVLKYDVKCQIHFSMQPLFFWIENTAYYASIHIVLCNSESYKILRIWLYKIHSKTSL